jgi:hypothetical protein
MKCPSRIAALALIVALLAGTATPVSAGGFLDPAEDAHLTAILQWLNRFLDKAMRDFDALQVRYYNVIRNRAFPAHVFDPIVRTIGNITSIRKEVEALSCSWQFSPRTDLLRGLYLKPLKLCKPSFQSIWGSDERAPDADREALNDYVSTLSHNMMSERVEQEDFSWDRIFNQMQSDSALLRKSPGESLRDTAANVAWLGQLTHYNSRVDQQALLTDELRWAAIRVRKRRAREAALMVWAGVAGRDPFGDGVLTATTTATKEAR